MKKIILLFVTFALIYSCNKNQTEATNSGIIGKWKLIEIHQSPGDLSAIVNKVESNKIIEFHKDSTITSNGDICSMSTEANSPTTGTYSLADSIIKSNGCNDVRRQLYFSQSDTILMLQNYGCFEYCGTKFKKAK